MGIIFICISAFVRHPVLNGRDCGDKYPWTFEDLLSEIGKGPLIFSIISLILGILCIIVPIIRKWLAEDLNQIKDNWEELDQPENADKNP